jgi:hypothetical protein
MSLLRTMMSHLGKEDGASIRNAAEPVKEYPIPPHVLFVATDLEFRKFDWVRTNDRDRESEGKIFRRLDPEYFAWLRSRMVAARSAHNAGKLPDKTWDLLRERFNRVQELAVEEFGEKALQKAVHCLNPKTYDAPSAKQQKKDWIYPAGEAWKCKQPVTSQALAKVDAIRDEAMACGWSEARLYQNQGRFRFPCGQDYGLVCFVDEDREIGAVTRQFIEIIHGVNTPRPNTLRFHNPDVSQPWLKKVETEK